MIHSLQEGVSLGCLSMSRTILATLGMLTTEHHANSVSLLLNSGLLALTQTVLRIIGPDSSSDNAWQDDHQCLQAILEEAQPKSKQQQVPISGPELAVMMKIGTRVMRGIDWKWGDQVQRRTEQKSGMRDEQMGQS